MKLTAAPLVGDTTFCPPVVAKFITKCLRLPRGAPKYPSPALSLRIQPSVGFVNCPSYAEEHRTSLFIPANRAGPAHTAPSPCVALDPVDIPLGSARLTIALPT